jgi:hypothetical protein
MSPRRSFAEIFPRTNRVLVWIWFVVIMIALLGSGFYAIRELADPATDGHVGSAAILECDDQGKYRYCFGDFRSNDGQVSYTDTRIWGEDGAHAGVGAIGGLGSRVLVLRLPAAQAAATAAAGGGS